MLRSVDINWGWLYNPGDANKVFEEVNIPHANILTPYNNFDENIYQFVSCYKKYIEIDDLVSNECVYIKFGGVMSYAMVFINGYFVGDHKGGYTPFRIDITQYVKSGTKNVITVFVDSTERKDIPPFGFVVDFLTYGGIYREVSLEYNNLIHIEHPVVKPIDVLTDRPKLDIDLHISNKQNIDTNLIISFKILWLNKVVHSFKTNVHLNAEDQWIINIIEEVPRDLNLWCLEQPNLYNLSIELLADNKVIDKHNIRFGFRDFKFNADGFYLNGERIKLIGLNRHQSFPYTGYAMPKSAQQKDADILKYELGVNCVRLSHYPQSDHFMNRCDELGLLVFDEIPGWQFIGDEDWQEVALDSVREMILKDVNHPSVFIWGIRINESQDSDLFYKKSSAVAKSLDCNRATGGVRCIKNSRLIEDVYTYNDFVHTGNNQPLDRKYKVTKSKKPYLVTEHNGHMFPTKKFDNEEHRIEHAIRHLNVINRVQGDDLITGAIGWCMFDYNTHKEFGSGDKICYHGVMDMFRIPKSAAYVYSSQSDIIPVMHVSSSMNMGENSGALLSSIIIFTNCDYIKLYKNGNYIGTFKPESKLYRNALHPPVIIDDFIGDAISLNESFTDKDAKIIKDILIKSNKKDVKLSLLDKIKALLFLVRYKMNIKDIADLFTKYIGGWGESATDYIFKGYIDDKVVLTRNKSQVFNPRLLIIFDSNELTEDITYDTTRVIIKLVDEFDNDIIYGNDSFILETEGPIKVIGPKVISLIGGSIGFWIKTTGSAGVGKVKIKSERFGNLYKEINVKKVIK